eukprot:14899603-Alexandrium_andersonii.AAC.3
MSVPCVDRFQISAMDSLCLMPSNNCMSQASTCCQRLPVDTDIAHLLLNREHWPTSDQTSNEPSVALENYACLSGEATSPEICGALWRLSGILP